MLKIDSLSKSYNQKKILDNLSLEINEGEIFSVVGLPNSGKTSLINCILSLTDKDSGEITISEDNIGYLAYDFRFKRHMKISKLIKKITKHKDNSIVERASYLMRQFDIDENKKINKLSLRELRKLEIVLCLTNDPKLIVMDDPTMYLDSLSKEIFYNILREEKEKGKTIVYTTSDFIEAKLLSDRIGIINDGKIVSVLSIDDLNKNNFKNIYISGPNCRKLRLPVKDIYIKKVDKNSIRFMYYGNINELIKILSEVEIDNLCIEDSTLEDILMHYYKM